MQLLAEKSRVQANGLAATTIRAHVNTSKTLDLAKFQFYVKDGFSSVRLITPEIGDIYSPENSAHTEKFSAPIVELRCQVRSTLTPGVAIIGLWYEQKSVAEIALEFFADDTDTDADGFPDVVELATDPDRQRFLQWFATIALAQFEQPSPQWLEAQRDCAGLIRFAYREALKQHHDEWYEAIGNWSHEPISDVEKYNYPAVPMLGVNLFRKNRLPFKVHEIDSLFSPFAEARLLRNYNCVPLGKDRRKAQTGDLVFFFHFDDADMPYHSMVFIKNETDQNNDLFVYHTGPRDHDKGEMRKITRFTFTRHPDQRWRPEISNPYFLGYYRWKIVD